MVTSLHIHRRERPRAPFAPSYTPLHQLRTARGQHRVRQGQRRPWLLGAIDAPSQPPHRRLHSDLIHTDLDGGVTLCLAPRWPTLVRAHGTRCRMVGHATLDEGLYAVTLHNGHHRLPSSDTSSTRFVP